MPTKKHRVTISVDKATYDQFRANLKRFGYPPGTLSWMVQDKMETINTVIEATGTMCNQLAFNFKIQE